jgi:hypothetical protein
MKITYRCEICGEESDDREEIERCEAIGKPDPARFPPIGLLVGDACGPGTGPSRDPRSPRCAGPEWNKGKPCGSHLCGGGFIWVVENCYADGHRHGVGFGNFRGNGAGDTFDFSSERKYRGYDTHRMGLCQYGEWKGFRDWREWPEAQPCPAFWRAVKALREAKIQPMVVRNGEAVPFDEPLPFDPYEAFPIGTEVRLKKSVKSTNCDKCGGSGVLVEMDDDRTHVPCDCRTAVAKVQGYIHEKEGGLKLDRKIGGFAYWNVADVEAAP